MKKQISLIILITTVLVILFGLTMQTFATDSEIQPRTGETTNNKLQPRSEGDIMPISENEEVYGEVLPQNEEQITSLNEDLKNISNVETKDNRGVIVAGIVIITIVIIAGLVVWYYKTNY